MIAGMLTPAHMFIDTAIDQSLREIGREQNMIEAEPRVARPGVPFVIPECVHGIVGMERAERIGPSARDELAKGGAAFGFAGVPNIRMTDSMSGSRNTVRSR
jgi:hypothetical protein